MLSSSSSMAIPRQTTTPTRVVTDGISNINLGTGSRWPRRLRRMACCCSLWAGLARLGEGGALEFAQGGARAGGVPVDALGGLVASGCIARGGDEGCLVEVVAGADRDPCGDLFAPVRVRHPGDGGFRHR